MWYLRLLVFFFSLYSSHSVFAQREASRWYFGENAGLNFNEGNPSPLLDGKLMTHEGCASISDSNGNLLFYTDGITVWDKTHQIMPNGQGLLGHESSTQSALIVPKTGSHTEYYVFTVNEPEPKDDINYGLNYTLVDLSLNNGYGDVVISKKNIHLITYNPNDPTESHLKCSEKLTAVQHENGTSTWVLTHFGSYFYSFKIDKDGVHESPVKSMTEVEAFPSGYKQNGIGYLKISPDGKKVGIAHSQTNFSTITGPKTPDRQKQTGKILLYDFDTNTGKVSNEQVLLSNKIPYGIEFSPKSSKLYTTVNNYKDDGSPLGSSLYQFDLSSSNIRQSIIDVNTSSNVAGALQLAIDGKIYRAGYAIGASGTSLSVINNPEALGTACNYITNTISLGGRFSALGLPPYVQSLFLLKFEFQNVCLRDETQFTIQGDAPFDSVSWDFGDGRTSNVESPKHVYTQPGEYTVTLTKTIGGTISDPITKTVTIYDAPKTPSNTIEYYQCTNTPNNNGIEKFNLANINSSVSLDTNQIINVFYYKDLQSAEMDTSNLNALPFEYRNTVPDEILIAKVINPISLCYSYAKVKLKVKQALTLDITDLSGCALGDATAEFHLDLKRESIRTQLNLSKDSNIQFYLTENKALLGSNDYLPDNFVSRNNTIYARVENENICYGSGKFDIRIEEFDIAPTQDILLCGTSGKETILYSGITNNPNANYTFEWSTGETTETINVTEDGIYSVRVTNDTGCSATSSITVTKTELPNIQNVKVSNDTVEIIIDGNRSFEYSLDDENNYQASNIFQNVPTGTHTIYVRNINGCGLSSQKVSVLAYPKFFTPNGDSNNDYWQIQGFDSSQLPKEPISIFDRYGSLLAQIEPTSQGWDGSYNGRTLESSDYWFSLTLADGRVVRGHFTLKR
ncbi:T9SS type B sorting domain-containing protein [Zobellia sp. B3R18]|uniref:T9SS type B sorting domain-containing protein n=1 Tax=Zobellia sp. B3R18 TaxID=2841568 RepID=UPI001C067A2A|nr:T9SS type B sorting domain-containing protein [Zobellia sp. B3R18]MBU2974211.1 T9SS type B sorting domain-containing protein [Zobellia sp. B3R18]